jgi:hypothetical protein
MLIKWNKCCFDPTIVHLTKKYEMQIYHGGLAKNLPECMQLLVCHIGVQSTSLVLKLPILSLCCF